MARVWEIRDGRLGELSLFDPDVVPALSYLDDDRRTQKRLTSSVRRSASDALLYMGT